MKIYFLGAVSGLEKYRNNYTKIVTAMESTGHKVLSDHVLITESTVQDLGQDIRKDYFKKMQRRIKTSDVMVVDVSHPTANIGFEVAYAQENEKPILVLRSEDSEHSLPALFEGNASDKFLTIEYSLNDIQETVETGLEQLKDMLDVRYNFFISKEIVDYLNHIARTRRIPRSVYLRTLVEQDMREDEDYQKIVNEEFSKNLLD